MNRSILPLVVALLALPVGVRAADAPRGAAAAAPQVRLAEGTVKKLDKAAASITLAHGPIDNIGMPAMTMDFKVKAPRLLDAVKPGDKVRFQVDHVGGEFLVVHIEAAK